MQEHQLTPSAKKALDKYKNYEYPEKNELKLFYYCLVYTDSDSLSFLEGSLGIAIDYESLYSLIDSYELKEPFLTEEQIISSSVKKSEEGLIDTEHLVLSLFELSDNIKEFLASIGLNPAEFEIAVKKLSEDTDDEPKTNQEDYGSFSLIPPSIQTYCKSLNDELLQGECMPIICRDKEIKELEETLLKRNKNNAVLVGEAGVGKTSVVYGLVQKILENDVCMEMTTAQVLSVDLTAMMSGCFLRGQFEEKMQSLISFAETNPNIILFFDEIEAIIKSSSGSSSDIDVSGILKPALARGTLMCIGTTTAENYHKHFEKDATFKRLFKRVNVDEPSKETTKKIIAANLTYFEDFHRVKYSDENLDFILDSCESFMSNKKFPDKAFDAIDLIGSKVKVKNTMMKEEIEAVKNEFVSGFGVEDATEEETYERLQTYIKSLTELSSKRPVNIEIKREDISEFFQDESKISAETIAESNDSFSLFEQKMNNKIFGQKTIIKDIYESLLCVKVGMNDPKKPLSNFLFAGDTSVGKTYTAKNIAKNFFGNQKAFIQINMSEYQNEAGILKLIGASSGYIGHEKGGLLTNFVYDTPNCVVLFDEIEKADPKVLDILLHLLDEGYVTDGENKNIDFSKAIVILTTNLKKGEAQRTMNFVSSDLDSTPSYRDDLKKHLRPELVARIENIHVFNDLSDEAMLQILQFELNETASRITKPKITIKKEVAGFLLDEVKSQKLHARNAKKLVRDMIQVPIAKFMIKNPKRKRISAKVLDKSININ